MSFLQLRSKFLDLNIIPPVGVPTTSTSTTSTSSSTSTTTSSSTTTTISLTTSTSTTSTSSSTSTSTTSTSSSTSTTSTSISTSTSTTSTSSSTTSTSTSSSTSTSTSISTSTTTTLPSYTEIFNPSYPTYFGNEINPENTSSDNVNASTIYWAGMIRPTVSKTVTSLQFVHWGHSGSFVVMIVGLYTDNSGQPGTLLQAGTVTPTADFTWESVSITSQAVVSGTPYWIVVHGLTLGLGNGLEMRRIDDPDQLISGLANRFSVAISTDSGSTWTNQGTTWCGCVGFGYSDSTFQGCGYGDFDTFSINNTSDQWGEYFQVPANITVNALSAKVIKDASGTPSADLTYVLMNADTVTTLASGILVTAGTVTTSFVWYTASFSNILLSAGVNYRFYLTSTTTASPQYAVHIPKTVNNGNSNVMTFGGATNVLAQNNNGIFQTDPTRDIPFRLTLIGALTTSTSSSTSTTSTSSSTSKTTSTSQTTTSTSSSTSTTSTSTSSSRTTSTSTTQSITTSTSTTSTSSSTTISTSTSSTSTSKTTSTSTTSTNTSKTTSTSTTSTSTSSSSSTTTSTSTTSTSSTTTSTLSITTSTSSSTTVTVPYTFSIERIEQNMLRKEDLPSIPMDD